MGQTDFPLAANPILSLHISCTTSADGYMGSGKPFGTYASEKHSPKRGAFESQIIFNQETWNLLWQISGLEIETQHIVQHGPCHIHKADRRMERHDMPVVGIGQY